MVDCDWFEEFVGGCWYFEYIGVFGGFVVGGLV